LHRGLWLRACQEQAIAHLEMRLVIFTGQGRTICHYEIGM